VEAQLKASIKTQDKLTLGQVNPGTSEPGPMRLFHWKPRTSEPWDKWRRRRSVP